VRSQWPQAMKLDGGLSFKCADSSAWRSDSTCGTASDFMTAGDSHGTIPAVPQGFVRFVKLHSHKGMLQCQGKAHYLYCGDDTTIPDTSKWTPLCDEFVAKMAPALRSLGGGVKFRMLHARNIEPGGSLEYLKRRLQALPAWLKLTLDDFNFAVGERAEHHEVSRRTVAYCCQGRGRARCASVTVVVTLTVQCGLDSNARRRKSPQRPPRASVLVARIRR
jgi:hypothetical protein